MTDMGIVWRIVGGVLLLAGVASLIVYACIDHEHFALIHRNLDGPWGVKGRSWGMGWLACGVAAAWCGLSILHRESFRK